MSVRNQLFRLPLTDNDRRLLHQWCDKRWTWTMKLNDIVFTDESRFCLQHHDGRIQVWRHGGEKLLNFGVMHLYSGPAPISWFGMILDFTAVPL
ncbi:transposable element Tc1 transposase [Trichonephila clavipes]|nr:transposable element Tc1 transposase [Trichonephila clavipes]